MKGTIMLTQIIGQVAHDTDSSHTDTRNGNKLRTVTLTGVTLEVASTDRNPHVFATLANLSKGDTLTVVRGRGISVWADAVLKMPSE